ncbi:MAG TPA: nucleotidyltransferase [Terriglobales bacterium]|nr:nucleotidyltransferase [Terriglobales bacterium]
MAGAIQVRVPTKDEDQLPISSSIPPEFAPEQEQLFREVLTLLNGSGVPYVISGAFALREHTGICRDTKDLDVFMPPADVATAMEYLHRHGFECEVADPVWLAKAHRGDFFVDIITGMSTGTITVTRTWIDRATPSELFGVPVKVLGAEELIASKLFVTRRERFDGADIAHVIYGTKGKMDWAWLMELVGEHWAILFWALVLYQYCYPAQTDYVPRFIWDDLLTRFRNEIENPNPDARFRGSLIDPRMFAIDVNEWRMPDLHSEYRNARDPKLPNLCENPAA